MKCQRPFNLLYYISLSILGILFQLNSAAQFFPVYHENANANPRSSNLDLELQYPYFDNSWTVIDSGKTTIPFWTSSIHIPFDFQFDSITYQYLKISNTGIITFDTSCTAALSIVPSNLPNTALPANSIFFHGLQNKGSDDYILSKCFGQYPNRQFWISYSSYASYADSNANLFLSIVLEEKSNKIYFVDNRKINANSDTLFYCGFQLDTLTYWQNIDSLWYSCRTDMHPWTFDNRYIELFPYSRQTNDICMSDPVVRAPFGINQGSQLIAAEIRNLGTDSLNSFHFHYKIHGSTYSCQKNLNLAPNESTIVYHSTPYLPPSSGFFPLKIFSSLPNQTNDGNPINDTLVLIIETDSIVYPREILFEDFVSSTCPPCSSANLSLKQTLLGLAQPFSLIKYPMNWPYGGDPYTNVDCLERKGFYSCNTIPNLYLDGKKIGHPGQINNYLIRKAYLRNAKTEIASTFIREFDTIKLDVSILTHESLTAGRLFGALVEKRTINNIGTNGETEFFQIVHQIIPDGKGQIMTNSQNQSFSFSSTCSQNIEDPENLEFIVFIQDTINQSIIQCRKALKHYPKPDLGPDINLCAGDSIQPQIDTNYYSYQWYSIPGNIPLSNNPIYYFDTSGTIVLEQEYEPGIWGYDTININLYQLPNVSLGNDTVICINHQIQLGSSGSFQQYLWSNGTSDSILNISADTLGLGTHCCSLTVFNNYCENTDTICITVDPCTDLSSEYQPKAQIHPNPFRDYFNISLSESGSFTYFVYDLQGKVIVKQVIDTNDKPVYLKSLKKGVYYIRIITEKGQYSSPLIKL